MKTEVLEHYSKAIKALNEKENPFRKQATEFEVADAVMEMYDKFYLSSLRSVAVVFTSHDKRFEIHFTDIGIVRFIDTSDVETKMKKDIIINLWDKHKRTYIQYPNDLVQSINSTYDKIMDRVKKLDPATYKK
jgi:hypothetical protein